MDCSQLPSHRPKMNGANDIISYKPIGVLTVAVAIIAAAVLCKPVWNFVITNPSKVSNNNDIICTIKCSYVHYMCMELPCMVIQYACIHMT